MQKFSIKTLRYDQLSKFEKEIALGSSKIVVDNSAERIYFQPGAEQDFFS